VGAGLRRHRHTRTERLVPISDPAGNRLSPARSQVGDGAELSRVQARLSVRTGVAVVGEHGDVPERETGAVAAGCPRVAWLAR
jgi:hypothetical protein